MKDGDKLVVVHVRAETRDKLKSLAAVSEERYLYRYLDVLVRDGLKFRDLVQAAKGETK